MVNESNSYHDIVMAMHEQAGGKEGLFYFVCDRNFVRKHGLGLLRPFPITRSLEPWNPLAPGLTILQASLTALGWVTAP